MSTLPQCGQRRGSAAVGEVILETEWHAARGELYAQSSALQTQPLTLQCSAQDRLTKELFHAGCSALIVFVLFHKNASLKKAGESVGEQ